MLNKIPKILSADLVRHMMHMGHGDELIIGDGNFPAESLGVPVVHLDGHGVCEVLDAILELMPLDSYVPIPVAVMEVVPGDTIVPHIWDEFREILKKHGYIVEPEQIERFAFYERSRKAFCIVATSEPAQYANIILKKGIVH
jgi:L-fucose mutarotase